MVAASITPKVTSIFWSIVYTKRYLINKNTTLLQESPGVQSIYRVASRILTEHAVTSGYTCHVKVVFDGIVFYCVSRLTNPFFGAFGV